MQSRYLRVLASCGLAIGLGLTACGSGGGAARPIQPACDTSTGQQGLCVVSCNLGCSLSGCNLTEIAQNQPIIFVFNQEIDPATVSTESIAFRTAKGEEPVGDYLVNGDTVTFVPEVQIVGGQSFFGFKANESYVLNLPWGGDISALRSTAGDPMSRPLTCQLNVSRGVVDLDGKPPEASLLSPAKTSEVDPETSIVLEFSELIDVGPFLGRSEDAPVQLRVLKAVTQNGKKVCKGATGGIRLSGTWRVENNALRGRTQASFAPVQDLPGGVCVQIEVTDRIRDLAGNPARSSIFQYTTVAIQQPEKSIIEPFENDLELDKSASSGEWSKGSAKPGALGWDGEHGEFDIALGEDKGGGVFEWNTDNLKIPRTKTLSGKDRIVTDGVFRFSKFELGDGQTLRFVGTKPVQIYVRGDMKIGGVIECSAIDVTDHNGELPFGAVPNKGGPFGAAGGKGGDACRGNGASPAYDGKDGEDIKLAAGHAYSGDVAGTGGKGSKMYPLHGQNAQLNYTFRNIICTQCNAGGGGAGFSQAGGKGTVSRAPDKDVGADTPGGKLFDLVRDNKVPAGKTVFDHFLVGGSGGGGAGSQPLRSFRGSTPIWHSGPAGAGGGGAIGIRVGGDLVMGAQSGILARGGKAPNNTNNATPAGGGGGGTIVIQVGGKATATGAIDVTGGEGGVLDDPFVTLKTEAGDGGNGYLRFESLDTPDPKNVPNAQPPATTKNVARLTERDEIVGSLSKFQNSKQLFSPDWNRYEIEARVDGQVVKFSDDPSKGRLASGDAPVIFRVQGGNWDTAKGRVDPDSVQGWRDYVGPFAPPGSTSLNDDGLNAFRFLLLFNRKNVQTVEVLSVRVFFTPL